MVESDRIGPIFPSRTTERTRLLAVLSGMQAIRTHESATAREPRRHEDLAQPERSRTVARGGRRHPTADRVRARGTMRPPLTRSPQRCTEDIVDTDAGTMLRVWHGKGDKFRETPVPRDLATTIRTVDDVRDAPTSLSLVEITSTRSLRRWVRSAADQLYDETGDAGWDHLGFHDLRRTWATALASDDVDPLQSVTGVGGTTSRPSSSIIGELQSRGSATRTPESELALSERSLHMRTEYFLVRFNRPAQ